MKILEIVWQPTYWQGLSCGKPRIDQPTSSDRSIKKRGRLVLQKCPGNVLKPFCGNVLTPLMSGIALRQFSQTTFSSRGNHQIMETKTVWVKSRRSKDNCLQLFDM